MSNLGGVLVGGRHHWRQSAAPTTHFNITNAQLVSSGGLVLAPGHNDIGDVYANSTFNLLGGGITIGANGYNLLYSTGNVLTSTVGIVTNAGGLRWG